MVGNLTALEILIALTVFTAISILGQRRIRRKIVRSARQGMRQVSRWFARTARVQRERAAEFRAGHVVTRIRTIDGDTIEDLDTGVRYRVANIDCPETDDRATCYRERVKGEQAKGAAEIIFSTAKRIEVRPVGRTDRHGRTVAYANVDDQDFGQLMIDKGFAVAWSGTRDAWCGEDGGLAALARATSSKHVCKTCGAGITRKPTARTHETSDTLVEFSVTGRRRDGGQN